MSVKTLEERIEVTGLSKGQLLGKAKRKFGDSHKVTTYTDRLATDEARQFDGDEVLLDLILQQIEIDQKIVAHIERVLADYREDKAALEAEKQRRKDAKRAKELEEKAVKESEGDEG